MSGLALLAAITLGLTALLAGCAVGPEYHRPVADMPPSWTPEAPWHEAAPSDTTLKGTWWELFQDADLNPLVEKALAGNQNLRVATARLQQSQDQLAIARSALLPSVELSASASRGKDSANRPLAAYSEPNRSTVQNDFRLSARP